MFQSFLIQIIVYFCLLQCIYSKLLFPEEISDPGEIFRDQATTVQPFPANNTTTLAPKKYCCWKNGTSKGSTTDASLPPGRSNREAEMPKMVKRNCSVYEFRGNLSTEIHGKNLTCVPEFNNSCADNNCSMILRTESSTSSTTQNQSTSTVSTTATMVPGVVNTAKSDNTSKNSAFNGRQSSGSKISNAWMTIVGSTVALVLLSFMLLCVGVRYCNSKRNLQRLMEQEIKQFKTGNFRASIVRNSITGGLSAQLFPFRNEVDEKDIEIEFGKLREQDNFMSVFPGTIKGRQAIVRTTDLKTEFCFFKELLKDIKVMSYICHQQHPNIVEFLGAEITNIHNRVIIAGFESSPLGNLRDFLRNVSNNNGTLRTTTEDGNIMQISIPNGKNKNSITTLTLLNWCDQMANAMVYLQHEGLVHGDLSASNIYLFPNNCVKISDLCSMRKEYERNYYIENFRAPPKWRWMAIELFRLKKFTVKTDVWAFGVALWEIFSLGENPHCGIRWSPKFVSELESGYRMDMPAFANRTIYQMLLRCWYRFPNDRLNFVQIKGIIKECIESLSLCGNSNC